MGGAASTYSPQSIIGVSEHVIVLRLCETSGNFDVVARFQENGAKSSTAASANQATWSARKKASSFLQKRNEWRMLELINPEAKLIVACGDNRLTEIDVSQLPDNLAHPEIIASKQFTLHLCRLPGTYLASRRRTVFAIRHAESIWNQGNPITMLSSIDHCLSNCGLAQAKRLDRYISQCSSESSSLEQAFCQCNTIYSSPHKRALQTALLALKRHPHIRHKGIQLLSLLREIRANAQCRDNMATARGDNIRNAALEALRHHHHQHQEDDAANLHDDLPFVDANDADHEWWSSEAEDIHDARARVKCFLQYILLADQETSIAVTHSNFLRTLFNAHASSVVAGTLATHKVQNCSVIAISFDFSRSPGNEIVEWQSLFSPRRNTNDDASGCTCPATGHEARPMKGTKSEGDMLKERVSPVTVTELPQ